MKTDQPNPLDNIIRSLPDENPDWGSGIKRRLASARIGIENSYADLSMLHETLLIGRRKLHENRDKILSDFERKHGIFELEAQRNALEEKLREEYAYTKWEKGEGRIKRDERKTAILFRLNAKFTEQNDKIGALKIQFFKINQLYQEAVNKYDIAITATFNLLSRVAPAEEMRTASLRSGGSDRQFIASILTFAADHTSYQAFRGIEWPDDLPRQTIEVRRRINSTINAIHVSVGLLRTNLYMWVQMASSRAAKRAMTDVDQKQPSTPSSSRARQRGGPGVRGPSR